MAISLNSIQQLWEQIPPNLHSTFTTELASLWFELYNMYGFCILPELTLHSLYQIRIFLLFDHYGQICAFCLRHTSVSLSILPLMLWNELIISVRLVAQLHFWLIRSGHRGLQACVYACARIFVSTHLHYVCEKDSPEMPTDIPWGKLICLSSEDKIIIKKW